jgi:hypothetical protein
MPLIDLFGGHLPRDQVFEGKLAANPAATSAPNVEIDRMFRNGLPPNATGYNQLAEAANRAALYRTREYFSWSGSILPPGSAGAGDRARWRFAMRTGNYAHAMGALVILSPQDAGTDQPARVRLDIATNAAGTPAVLTQEFVFGASGGISTHLNNYKMQVATIDGLSANTDYYCTLYDVDNGRAVSASCWELASLSENSDGYLAQNFAAGTPVLDIYRSNLLEQMRAVWKTCGAKVFNWSIDATALMTTSNTATNVVDGVSTAVSAATPGLTIDMRYRNRASQTSGVPCVMKVFGSWTKNASPNAVGGTVIIKDSAGATIGAITNGWSSSTATWVSSGSFNWPASQGKVDVTYNSDTGGGEFRLYAITCWQQDP